MAPYVVLFVLLMMHPVTPVLARNILRIDDEKNKTTYTVTSTHESHRQWIEDARVEERERWSAPGYRALIVDGQGSREEPARAVPDKPKNTKTKARGMQPGK
jgi:hypothetical protein